MEFGLNYETVVTVIHVCNSDRKVGQSLSSTTSDLTKKVKYVKSRISGRVTRGICLF